MSDKRKKDTNRSILRGIEEFTDNWTEGEWVHWVYMLGHMLDKSISWQGMDNRYRIEMVISEWLALKQKPEIDEAYLEDKTALLYMRVITHDENNMYPLKHRIKEMLTQIISDSQGKNVE